MQRNNSIRTALLGTSTLGLALTAGFAAQAQEVLETVIVTAEKQATDIQKTAVSVTAILPENQRGSGEVLLEDLLKNVATIDVHKGGGSANRAYFVRGIGSSTGSASVPVFYDGVQDSTNLGHVGASFDTARVEVLRGPQGTLYGRGAFAGALLVGLIDTLARSYMVDVLRLFTGAAAARGIANGLSSMFIYVLMAVVLFVRPEGLFPARGRS